MELFFNSVWALVAIASVGLWLRLGRRGRADRHMSFIGLVMLIVILFPVISVSDDLWSIQNPAETDSCQRRDHGAYCPHAVFPAIAALPVPILAALNFGFQPLTVPLKLVLPAVENPALGPIQNRPPPAA